MMIKYRVREVAKDLDIPNKDVIDILAKYFPEPKKYMTALTEEELDQIHAQLGCEGACDACDLCDSCIHSTFHHHHHADEVFTSWGVETPKAFTMDELKADLAALDDGEKYGAVLRAKGIVKGEGCWIHFDYVPGESNIRTGSASVMGRLCVIGSKLNEHELSELFGV
mgnify:CR=1 FL=1